MASKSVKFNAGKVEYDEDTKRCTPLPFKGTITITPNADDEDFYDYTWVPKSNNSGNVQKDDLLIIPGDVSFKKVESCKTGRVVALTFLSSGAKNLYWLQDVGDDDALDRFTEKDNTIIQRVNELISLGGEDDDDEEEDGEGNNEIDHEPQVSRPENRTSSHSFPSLTPANINNIRQEPQSKTTTTSALAPTSQTNKETENILMPIGSISDVITPSAMEAHLDTLSSQELADLYGPLLPPSYAPTKHNIMEIVRSSFFQQTSEKLSELLKESNGAGYLLSQSFKFEYQGEGIQAFLEGIRQAKSKSPEPK